jgi:hypothetical protein
MRILNLAAGGGGRSQKSYDREKAWYSIHHSIITWGKEQFFKLPKTEKNLCTLLYGFPFALVKWDPVGIRLL